MEFFQLFAMLASHLLGRILNQKTDVTVKKKMRQFGNTKDVFHGCDVPGVWEKEESKWKALVNSTQYPFPKLSVSPFQNDRDTTLINLKQPVICQDIQWSADGTSFITFHDDYGIREYLVPEGEDKCLVPFKRFFKTQSIINAKVHPKYSPYSEELNFNVMIVSSKDLPIQLYSLAHSETRHYSLFSYDTMNPENERYETTYAIDFLNDTEFVAGSVKNKIAVYDLNRKLPVWTSQFTKKKCGKRFHRAIVSCFDQSTERHDHSRYMGTYKNELFKLDTRMQKIELLRTNFASNKDFPSGIIQLLQSVNGHYIYVVKRDSALIDVLDVRQSCCQVNELILPFKIKKQKFKASLNSVHGLIIGDEDGNILKWDSSIVEFGGIATSGEPSEGGLVCSEYCSTGYSSRVNIVSFNPDDPNVLAMSYSPNKFSEDKEWKSGLSVLTL